MERRPVADEAFKLIVVHELVADVERARIEWSIHPQGDHRPDIAPGADTITLTILIKGRFEQTFPDQHPGRMLMERPGDFALYGPGIPHTWRALADSVMLTVRWPAPAEAGTRQ
jgi:hypothetical protein